MFARSSRERSAEVRPKFGKCSRTRYRYRYRKSKLPRNPSGSLLSKTKINNARNQKKLNSENQPQTARTRYDPAVPTKITNPPATRPRRPGTPRRIMAIREQWKTIIAITPIECRRCHRPITASQPWQLGHPQEYPYAAGNVDQGLAPEHKSCNQGNRTTNRQPTFTW